MHAKMTKTTAKSHNEKSHISQVALFMCYANRMILLLLSAILAGLIILGVLAYTLCYFASRAIYQGLKELFTPIDLDI